MRFGSMHLGRLTFRTAEEARGAARDLGLSGIHKHTTNGETVFMPGRNHQELNRALRERGMRPTPMPGHRGMGRMGGRMDDGMADDGGMDMGMMGRERDGMPTADLDQGMDLLAKADAGIQSEPFDGDRSPVGELPDGPPALGTVQDRREADDGTGPDGAALDFLGDGRESTLTRAGGDAMRMTLPTPQEIRREFGGDSDGDGTMEIY